MSEPRGKSKHMTSVLGMSKLDSVAGPWRQHEEEEGREMSLGTTGQIREGLISLAKEFRL